MTSYIENLKKELDKRNLTELEKHDILNDHKEMIEEAKADGISEDDLISKFGTPKQVAEALASEEKTEKQVNKTYAFTAANEPFDVTVSLVNEDVNIAPSDDDSIHVHFEKDKYLDKYDVTFKNHCLTVKRKKTFVVFEKSINQLITILLPKEHHIKQWTYQNVNGDTEINYLHTDNFKVSVVNGDLNLKQITANNVKLNTVGSDVSLENVVTDVLDLSQVSGDLHMKYAQVKHTFSIGTVSGDIFLEEVTCDAFHVSAVSGDIQGNEFYPESIKFSSVSGDVNIKNKEDKDINIKKSSTLSGDITISH